jgi:uncharacterized protein YoxC
MHSQLPQYMSVIFTVVTAFGVLLQALVLLAMFLGLRETQKKVTEALDKVNEHLYPILGTSRQLLEDISPKLKVITANLVETTETIRQEVHHIDSVVGEVVDKSRVQAARVDGMVTDTLSTVAQAAKTVEDGIAAPIRQIHGMLNGLRAGLDVLRSRSRRDHSPEDGDLFV